MMITRTPFHFDFTVLVRFHGIMFDIAIKEEIPVESVIITSVWVRGGLGDVNVYYSTESHANIYHNEEEWIQVYRKKLPRSFNKFVELSFKKPLTLEPGQRYGIYIHSPSSTEAIVYDDERSPITFENSFFTLFSGLASVNSEPFGPSDGFDQRWPWRPHREFVGKLSFGIRFALWRPIKEVNLLFNREFRRGCLEVVKSLRFQKSGPALINDVTYHILNMLPFDWFNRDAVKTFSHYCEDQQSHRSGQPVGWTGDWTVYQGMIFSHMIEFQRRTGVLVDAVTNHNDDIFAEETMTESDNIEDDS